MGVKAPQGRRQEQLSGFFGAALQPGTHFFGRQEPRQAVVQPRHVLGRLGSDHGFGAAVYPSVAKTEYC